MEKFVLRKSCFIALKILLRTNMTIIKHSPRIKIKTLNNIPVMTILSKIDKFRILWTG